MRQRDKKTRKMEKGTKVEDILVTIKKKKVILGGPYNAQNGQQMDKWNGNQETARGVRECIKPGGETKQWHSPV